MARPLSGVTAEFGGRTIGVCRCDCEEEYYSRIDISAFLGPIKKTCQIVQPSGCMCGAPMLICN